MLGTRVTQRQIAHDCQKVEKEKRRKKKSSAAACMSNLQTTTILPSIHSSCTYRLQRAFSTKVSSNSCRKECHHETVEYKLPVSYILSHFASKHIWSRVDSILPPETRLVNQIQQEIGIRLYPKSLTRCHRFLRHKVFVKFTQIE